jgi:hypothetical protein
MAPTIMQPLRIGPTGTHFAARKGTQQCYKRIFWLTIFLIAFNQSAHATLLSELIDNKLSIVEGNLVFDHFTFTPTSGNTSAPEADITGITNGLLISGNPNCCGGGTESGNFGYQVHVTSGTINAVTAMFTLAGTTGTGNEQNVVNIHDPSASFDDFDATVTVTPGNSITVSRIASVNHTDLFVTNTFTVTPTICQVPCPGFDAPVFVPVAQQLFFQNSPSNPILPDSLGIMHFGLTVTPGATVYLDPAVAVGYDYTVTGGVKFASVTLPIIGNSNYELCLWDGSGFNLCGTSLTGGLPFAFGGAGVDRFEIRGIDPNAGLDPNNPQAFVTGLTFTAEGNVDVTMTAFAQNVSSVPEPSTWLLFGSGLIALLCWRATVRNRMKCEMRFGAIGIGLASQRCPNNRNAIVSKA